MTSLTPSPRRRPGRPVSDSPGVVPVTTTMPRPLRDWLRGYAAAEDVPMAQVMTRALLLYRERVDSETGDAGQPA